MFWCGYYTFALPVFLSSVAGGMGMKKLLLAQCQVELLGAHSCKRLQWCTRVQSACVYSW
jgi:hypothetical protein